MSLWTLASDRLQANALICIAGYGPAVKAVASDLSSLLWLRHIRSKGPKRTDHSHTLVVARPLHISSSISELRDSFVSLAMAHLLLRGARAGAASCLRLAAVSNASTGASAAARCFATDATAAKVRYLAPQDSRHLSAQHRRMTCHSRNIQTLLCRVVCRLRFQYTTQALRARVLRNPSKAAASQNKSDSARASCSDRCRPRLQGGSSLPWLLALGGGGAGIYLAKEAGYLDGIFGGASTPKIPSTKVSPHLLRALIWRLVSLP